MIQICDLQVEDLVIFSVLLVVFMVQLCYWLSYIHLLRHIPSSGAASPAALSVIVVVNGNHREWVLGDMKALFTQDHPMYEVVVVNDCGGDELTSLLQTMCIEHPILRYTEIIPDKKFGHTAKVAKLMGIKCARYDNLIFIEPWTRPSSSTWLTKMASGFGQGKDVVIGMSLPVKDNKWWNGLARSFAMSLLIHSSAAALSGRPFRASRSNFGFSKNLYFSAGGYNYLTTGYGDNDLYLRRIAKPGNSSLVLSQDSVMLRTLPSDFGQWMEDTRFSTAMFMHYRMGVKISAFVYLASLVLFWLMIVGALVWFWPSTLYLALTASLLLIRQVLVYSIYSAISRKLSQKGMLGAFVIYDLIAPLWELTLWFSRRFGMASKF